MAPSQNDLLIRRTTGYLIEKYSPSGNKVGWLMISSILIEAWDLYSISFILIFLQDQYKPSALMLGLVAGSVQLGAVIGALGGGWLSDKIGRRVVFLSTMVTFVVLGLAQGFAPNMATLMVIRFLLGIPLGADIANGYTYIMESMPRGKREIMGNRWQGMFGLGSVLAIIVTLILLLAGVDHSILWRIVLGFGAVPAVILFILRRDLPETAVWLVQRGKWREAKQVTTKMYDDALDFLPDRDVDVPHPKLRQFLKEIRPNPLAFRSTIFGWISCFAQGAEHATFGFFVPITFILVGVSGVLATNVTNLIIYGIGAIAGFIGPQLTPKLGQRGLSITGYSITFVALTVTGLAILTHNLVVVPIAVCFYLWGHYWDASNAMTVASVVAPPAYRGTASGFSYIFTKAVSFLGITLFPLIFEAIGQGLATLLTACFSLVGLLSAIFIFREIYGYAEVGTEEAVEGA
jgi:MFS family permease